MPYITEQNLLQTVEALLNGASFNYDEGNTRHLVGEARKALTAYQQVSQPTTFYYSVRTGRMEANRRLAPRPRVPAPH